MNQNKKMNGWKWAFIILVVCIFLAGLYIYLQVNASVNTGDVNTEMRTQNNSEMSFDISAEKEDITQLVNIYLNEETQGDFIDYEFNLDQYAEIHGSFDVFGLSPQFSMYFEPNVLENGNVVFNAEELSIGSLNLPISFVLSQIAVQVDFPEFVAINSDDRTIGVNLNEFELDNGLYFSANQINLNQDIISMTIHLPESTLE